MVLYVTEIDNTWSLFSEMGKGADLESPGNYGEGPLPTLAVRSKRQSGVRQSEVRYRLWGTDAAGNFWEVIVAPYAEYGVWRCVTAYKMSTTARKSYLRKVRR
ncbi:hypothetical protein [Candidatus Hakubella thermalkaliphila]|uniref:hypothetical protein n=1 Tax=Candidatus Hakubella thermalkaliphila TaxID=2754717 RepID=UPI001592D8BA|nr:hypothetical protein [Candidatus Hakubella thermalkaliphila]